MKMRKFLFAFTALSTSLILVSNAHAQMAVIDSANLTQNVQTAAQAIIAVEQLKAQLTQLQQTYQMFTNPTDIMNMATGMENQTLENPMPAANALTGLLGGQTSPSGPAQTFYNQNHVYSPTDGSAASNQLNTNAAAISNIQGMAATNLSAIQQRLQQLPDLEADLGTATSITQIAAINGRISTESQFVQGQQAQATNLQVLATEQSLSQQQQVHEQFVQGETQTGTDMQAAEAANEAQQ
jgi:type IV secretion system protein VirB5